MENLSHEQFLAYVRSDLNHLYDPNHLRRSPLTTLFKVSERLDAASALQKILLEAIEQLKPGDNEPPQSRMWRVYDILLFRYVHGYERDKVSSQLGLSGRQFSREQLTALETLALQLWEKYALEKQPAPRPEAARSLSPLAPADKRPDAAWLKDLPPEKYSSLKLVLTSILELTRPLTRQWQTELHLAVDELPERMVPQYALRHALLNVLGIGIPWSNGGSVQIGVQERAQEADFTVECTRSQPGPVTLGDAENANLEIALQLARLHKGQLELVVTPTTLTAVLTLPVMEQEVVLVIDDNADILQLYERYVQGTRYSIVSSQNPAEALALAEKISPRIIVLDVMMPEMDGWDILMHFREQPQTSDIPIVICTILPQAGLAHSLGANAFLQKPVLPEDFIRTLNELSSSFKNSSPEPAE